MEDVSLDLSLAFVPRTVCEILGEVSHSKDWSHQRMATLENFVKRLEDEKKKIEAFKRELPLCMILVNDAITRLKEEINGGVRMKDEPIVEELMPLMKSSYGENGSLAKGKESCGMKNWMDSVQLWNIETKSRNEEDDGCVPNNPIQQENETNMNGGASRAFKGNKCVSKTVTREEKEVSKIPSLSLMSPVFELNHSKREKTGRGYGSSLITSSVEIKGQSQPPQNPRKQRRCWSPELHRRFVDALQQLGGPQVATPKQIRELIPVAGLTNDEVKSHLQKYRLHFRRPQVCSVGEANSDICMMVEENCVYNKSKVNLSQSGSPQGPLFLGGSNKGLSSSGRNSTDTEEDEQSDCRNWKGVLLHQHPESEVL